MSSLSFEPWLFHGGLVGGTRERWMSVKLLSVQECLTHGYSVQFLQSIKSIWIVCCHWYDTLGFELTTISVTKIPWRASGW